MYYLLCLPKTIYCIVPFLDVAMTVLVLCNEYRNSSNIKVTNVFVEILSYHPEPDTV